MKSIMRAVFLLPVVFMCIPAVADLVGTLKKVKETGEITFGVREASTPFSYADDKGKIIGYSIDLCTKIAEAVKRELKLAAVNIKTTPVTPTNRMILLANGTIDMECGAATNSLERQKMVAFGVTTFVAQVKVLTKKEFNIKKFDDLNGQPISATAGTTAIQLIKSHEKGTNVDFKEMPAKDNAEAFLLLESGRSKAFVLDDILLAGFVANSKKPQDFVMLEEVLRAEPYGIMLRKDDPAFKKIVDDTLVGLIKSKEIEKIYNKWFVSSIPPKGINLNFPMPNALKEAFKNPNDKGI